MARPPFSVLDFVGQRQALEPVLREQDGAMARGEPLPHIIATGPSGIGKSRFARMISCRAGTECSKFNGTESYNEVVELLQSMKACDVAYFDECHKLSESVQEMLYEVIDSGSVAAELVPDAPGKERAAIAPVTLIFATDQPGRLLNALFKRIPTHVHFKPYPDVELKEIVQQVAGQKNILLTPQAAMQLAKVCNGLPRRAEHQVRKLRLFFADSEQRQLGQPDVQEFLKSRGIDADGLGDSERRYLRFLAKNRSASIESLVGYLGTDAAFIRGQIEQPLRYRGLITVRSSGRVLTRDGKVWVREYRLNQKKKDKKE